ncbi:MAG: tetratricopeptide repeat protein [Steroidobacteraceae bacterium]
MTAFIVLAGALTLGVAVLVAAPLLREKGRAGRAPWAALGAVAVLAIGGSLLYVRSSSWSWSAPNADSPQAMVARLARRLEREPDDLEGWLMLGRSHIVLQQYPLAARAYRRADELAGGRNAEALIGLGETFTLSNDAELEGRAGRLFEAALALDPKSGKALFFSAAAAMRRGELALARERFATLLTLDPPASVRPILEQQIAALDHQTGPTAALSPAATASVRVDVDIAPKLRDGLAPDAPLFVIVRDPQAPGPPLAVKRLAARFPQSVELTSADAMIPGRELAAGQNVQIVARVAQSGSATARSGDPFGEVRYHVGRDGAVRILIDRLTP